jgi:hypothetical protein
VFWIRIRFNAASFYLSADPDPVNQTKADPDPGQTVPSHEKILYVPVGNVMKRTYGGTKDWKSVVNSGHFLVPGSGSGSAFPRAKSIRIRNTSPYRVT